MNHVQDFTKGTIFGPLIRFTIPTFLAMLLQVAYGAVDLLIAGKFGVTADVSAVSTGSQLMQTLTLLIVGLAMGATVLLGQYLGENRREEAGNVIGGAVVLFAIISAVFTIVFPLITPALARLCNAPAEAFDRTVSYIRICTLGSVCITAYNLLCCIFRGMGDSRTPLMSVAIACVINIIGDYILIAKCGMGSAGAAIATVGAQAISVIICLIVITKRGFPFPFSRKNIAFHRPIMLRILRLGIPLGLQDFLVHVSFLVILAIVNAIGLNESAGLGIAQKISGFIMLIPISVSQSLSAFVAQNYGARHDERSVKALKYAITIAFSASIVIFFLSFFRGDILASVFTDDPKVIKVAAEYMKAFSIDALLTSFMFCFSGYFTGCGRTKFVMFHGIFSAFCIRIPISYFMSRQVPVSIFHIGLATPCSTFVQCFLCAGYFILMHRESKKEQLYRV